jgi:hypothetical protein
MDEHWGHSGSISMSSEWNTDCLFSWEDLRCEKDEIQSMKGEAILKKISKNSMN